MTKYILAQYEKLTFIAHRFFFKLFLVNKISYTLNDIGCDL